MNKRQCANVLAEMFPQYLPSRHAAQQVLDEFLELIKGEVAAGRKVSLFDFGAFERVEHAPRNYKNFEGKVVKRGKTAAPKFTPYNDFKERCVPKKGRPQGS